MKRSGPPTTAAWLLKRIVVDEALVGDLAEEFQARGSGAWYWRQVLTAAAMITAKEISGHKLLAIRGAMTGSNSST
jgi:hypothetical protein